MLDAGDECRAFLKVRNWIFGGLLSTTLNQNLKVYLLPNERMRI